MPDLKVRNSEVWKKRLSGEAQIARIGGGQRAERTVRKGYSEESQGREDRRPVCHGIAIDSVTQRGRDLDNPEKESEDGGLAVTQDHPPFSPMDAHNLGFARPFRKKIIPSSQSQSDIPVE